MKQFWKDFLFRGLVSAASGPLVLAIIYGILGATGEVTSLTPREVCLGILSITLLAFIVAGITAIYQVEKLPLASATLIHGGVLYATYLLIYLINGWLQKGIVPIMFPHAFQRLFLHTFLLLFPSALHAGTISLFPA